MKEKRLLIAGCDPAAARSLAQATGLSPLLCSVLTARGIRTAAEAFAFLDTSAVGLLDPNTL